MLLSPPASLYPMRKKSRGRTKKDSEGEPAYPELAFRMLVGLHKLEAREHAGRISLTELARRIGAELGRTVGVAMVGKWFAGTRRPGDQETMRAAAAVFGVNPIWLDYGEGELGADPGRPEHPEIHEERIAPRELGTVKRSTRRG